MDFKLFLNKWKTISLDDKEQYDDSYPIISKFVLVKSSTLDSL
jgi:hypothetical protein